MSRELVEMVEILKEQYRTDTKWFSVRWHYIEGCIMKAYLDSYEQSGAERDYGFVKRFIDRQFDENGDIPAIRTDSYNIDQIRMAVCLFPLWQRERDPRYKKILDGLYGQLAVYPRTKAGSFWHKENYPYQVWLDGLYMGQPFLVQYIKQFAARKDYSDTVKQFRNVREFIYHGGKRLYSHAYDESRAMLWCDKETGQSPNVWLRAIGWFAMALVDVLELLEGEPAEPGELRIYLKELADDMLPHRHSSGMWHQVVDRADAPGNYLESSGTLMLAYALLKGVRLGYLSSDYRQYGVEAFEGTLARYLREEAGEVLLGGICRSAGLGKKPETGEMRDGSLNYYIFGEAVADNNGHGVAPLLMAFNEIKRLAKS
ncbi:glycoside hydrolase family 88/105 protein [Paenibacillus arenilitoris]|uniref:Glycoside hydrolase family 88 protein n=1 Tax=Paenibacillus arenilitoris TaxID=2772299 RepID=A0A927H4D6_9BACL|nr:glycoside hydrolase family 88 protein [Paenibacillus arenilitoris]MBD2867272.1 glycoside hydrolase family 88 protein [Paenibacillus arenilitoris]